MDIMKETTLQEISKKMQMQNALLAAIAEATPGSVHVDSFAMIQELVDAGLAKKIFAVGDQIICPWTNIVDGKVYEWVWDISHMGDVTLADGSVVPGMYLESHYLTPFTLQFDAPENEEATESTFQEGLFYYLNNSDGSYALQDVTYGDPIPEGTVYYHNEIKDPTGNILRYGYNRYSHSARHQFYNSKAEKGNWWNAKHIGDKAPSQLNSLAGLMTGFEEDFLSVIAEVQVPTLLNTVTDTALGESEIVNAYFFDLSVEQVYGSPQKAGVEGSVLDYYKQATGLTAPSNGNNTGRIKYRIDSKTSADWRFLRSLYRGYSCYAWLVLSPGGVGFSSANSANRCAPACVIAKSRKIK